MQVAQYEVSKELCLAKSLNSDPHLPLWSFAKKGQQ